MEEYVSSAWAQLYPLERKSSARLGERYFPGKCPGALTCSTDERTDRKVSCLVPGGEEDENGDWSNYNWG